jgi:hypothetical protein
MTIKKKRNNNWLSDIYKELGIPIPNHPIVFKRYGKLQKPVKQSHPRLRQVISMMRKDCLVRDFPKAFRLVVWELMRTQTRLAKLEKRCTS